MYNENKNGFAVSFCNQGRLFFLVLLIGASLIIAACGVGEDSSASGEIVYPVLLHDIKNPIYELLYDDDDVVVDEKDVFIIWAHQYLSQVEVIGNDVDSENNRRHLLEQLTIKSRLGNRYAALYLAYAHSLGYVPQISNAEALEYLIQSSSLSYGDISYHIGEIYDPESPLLVSYRTESDGISRKIIKMIVSDSWNYHLSNMAASSSAKLRKESVKDFGSAFNFYHQAALGGNVRAQRRVAQMYRRGLGVVANQEMASYWDAEAAVHRYRGLTARGVEAARSAELRYAEELMEKAFGVMEEAPDID
ncbi:sel1 repeat family protein [Isoalcanivorax indicus]|uniref:sel1 repeat family protein n=1 Tax=Isoalcanivorax indicus TaxID=2202653 RepID=UPI0013C48C21|nr:sel1 repeat family protein [Isoalcanivorax indicus]